MSRPVSQSVQGCRFHPPIIKNGSCCIFFFFPLLFLHFCSSSRVCETQSRCGHWCHFASFLDAAGGSAWLRSFPSLPLPSALRPGCGSFDSSMEPEQSQTSPKALSAKKERRKTCHRAPKNTAEGRRRIAAMAASSVWLRGGRGLWERPPHRGGTSALADMFPLC